ncbi:uncharacterized protein LOC134814358 isoform X6 [Bolinopsis microptera]|uniref:uncharacterized protein LOC134814358 isoform X6 n=1 Tax=Bolinopsis microptera TaxID=2820187 RepID=UPI0030791773
MLAQQGTLERSALGPKPEVILPFYQGSRSPSPETAGQTLAEENHIVFIGSEKPDLLLPDYRRYETHEPSASDRQGSTQVQLHNPGRQDMSRKSGKDRAAKLDWSANIDNASPRYEVIGSKPDIILPMFGYQSPLYKSPVPSRLDWSANIEIESQEYNMLPSPAIVAQNAPLLENAPLLKKTWTPKQDAELMLDMQQDEVISRIHSISAREKTRKRRSVTQSFKLKMFNRKPSRKQAPSRAEVISYVPNKTEPNENIKKLRGNVNRRSVRDEIASNMMSAYREQHRAKAKEIEFSFPMEIVPPLAKQFIDETKLVRTETGELAYELDEEEGYLLRNCDKHKYLRRSQTDPRPLDLLGSPERTEFGSVIRRSGTVCLPTSNQQLSELELQGLTDLMGYKKLCRIEKQYTTQSVNIIDRKLSLVEQLKQLPKEECMIPTPPPSTPTPTPPPSPEEEDYTPIQYQYVVPTVQTRVASAEDSTRPVSRKYTEVLTPPAVTPIPEVEEDVKEEEMLLEHFQTLRAQ